MEIVYPQTRAAACEADGKQDFPASAPGTGCFDPPRAVQPMPSSSSPPGLPDTIRACLFDMDGVLTRTTEIHAKAWKETFDEYLHKRADAGGEPFREFRLPQDYDEYVDGKPRTDGVRSFLESRGITLPEHSDDPGEDTLQSIGDRKNDRVNHLIETQGVKTFEGSVRYVREARRRGIAAAVVSSSANTKRVLEVTDLTDCFDAVVDGVVAEEEGLHGKPAPDTFLEGAKRLDVPPDAAAVFEDALAGVQAGRDGKFGCVIGVDRSGEPLDTSEHARGLREHGADRVVSDLSELLDEAD